MSRQLSDTSNLSGLIQKYEQELGYEQGFVSGNTKRVKQFISDTRSAWDRYLYLSFRSNGTWQYDDSNHIDYPIIYRNIVSGQQDYTFTTDEQSNLILDIYKVAVLQSATATEYTELLPVDQQKSGQYSDGISSESSQTGTPNFYDKTANGVFLDLTPNYNATNGLKIWINREASYYTYTDFTNNPSKMPGCPGIHHDYFFLRPAMEEAGRKKLDNYDYLKERVMEFEGDEKRNIIGSIEKYFSSRIRDERPQITIKKVNFI